MNAMQKGQKPTLDDFLETIDLTGKDVAVMGTRSEGISVDPSVLYFANRMVDDTTSSLTVIDLPTIEESAYHSNVMRYIDELLLMPQKGIPVIEPTVLVGDNTEMDLENHFDIIYDVNNFKRRIYLKWDEVYAETCHRQGDPDLYTFGKEIIETYHRMLKPGGSVIFVSVSGTDVEGRPIQSDVILKNLLEEYPQFEFSAITPLVQERYTIRNIDRDKAKRFGMKEICTEDGNGFLPDFRLGNKQMLHFGSDFDSMAIYTAKKNNLLPNATNKGLSE